jgi:hypothetical protein
LRTPVKLPGGGMNKDNFVVKEKEIRNATLSAAAILIQRQIISNRT